MPRVNRYGKSHEGKESTRYCWKYHYGLIEIGMKTGHCWGFVEIPKLETNIK